MSLRKIISSLVSRARSKTTRPATRNPNSKVTQADSSKPNTLTWDQFTVGDFSRRLASQPVIPYEILFGHERPVPSTIKSADEIMNDGWVDRNFSPVRIDPPFDWKQGGYDHRSWRFHLHSWDMLGPVLTAYEMTSATKYITFAAEVALDWSRQHNTLSSDDEFAWYDMAIGLRAYRLAYITSLFSRLEPINNDGIKVLLNAIQLHQSAFKNEKNFAAHSNHGFYFAAGQLAMARRLPNLPGMAEQEIQGRDRLRQLINSQFTDEGVHKEHSPDYHRMVWDTLSGLIRAGLIEDKEVLEQAQRIQEALCWFILPNGRMAMFGDTPGRIAIRQDTGHSVIGNPALQFVLSGGQSGKPPDTNMRIFQNSGYAVVRDGWPNGPSKFRDHSYLAQIAAFHSRTHKHADNLSILWYDHGYEILVDSGRFGYLDRTEANSELGKKGFYYAHPNRVYVESTRAHNTVEIDGESHERKGVPPYGSALRQSGHKNGLYFVESEMKHLRSVRHCRLLLFRPKSHLIVYDWLWDNNEKEHDFRQWFQLAPELTVSRDEAGFIIGFPDELTPTLYALPLLDGTMSGPYYGDEGPPMAGFMSRQDNVMIPSCSISVDTKAARSTQYAMLFSFGQTRPEISHAACAKSGRKGKFRWKHDNRISEISYSRPIDGDITVKETVALVPE